MLSSDDAAYQAQCDATEECSTCGAFHVDGYDCFGEPDGPHEMIDLVAKAKEASSVKVLTAALGRDDEADTVVVDDPMTVTRTKIYPSIAHPGPAWKWVYTVAIPGEPHTFSGDSLSWVRWLCKRKAPQLHIVYAWKGAK